MLLLHQKTLLKYPKMIIASEVYRRNQDLGVLKPILILQSDIEDYILLMGIELIYVNYKVVDYEALLDGDFRI
jgi:hypothetical protein